MNRKNKYRGQRTDTKEWVYGNLLKLETDYFTDSNDTGFMWYIIPLKTNGSWSKEKLMLKFISPCFEVIPETVGQCTGLKDKNGKEIYEGDIIEKTYYSYHQPECSEIFKIIYNGLGFSFEHIKGRFYHTPFTEEIEVIGNIHDNPELIRRKNNGISK